MGERSIEVKVGALILVSLALLAIFVIILGRVTTTEGFNLNVLFVHPGPLQPGAPVKIAGSEVGYVDTMTYLGREGPFMPPREGMAPDAPRVAPASRCGSGSRSACGRPSCRTRSTT